MAVQFKSTGVPLFKSTGVVAMGPDCCCDDGPCVGSVCQDSTWEWGLKICSLTLHTPNAPAGVLDNSNIISDLVGLWVPFGVPGGSGGNVGPITVSDITGSGYTLQVDGISIDVSSVDVTFRMNVTTGCTRNQNCALVFNSRVTGSGCVHTPTIIAICTGFGLTNCDTTDSSGFSLNYVANDLSFGTCLLRTFTGRFLNGADFRLRRGPISVSDPGCA